MVNITVLKSFYDLKAHTNRMPGETFEATKERAEHIAKVLPGYITFEEPEPEPINYESMTVQQLTALAKERGVMPRGRVSKATLVKILSEE